MNAEIDRRWIYPLLAICTLTLSSYATSSGEISNVRLLGGVRPSEGRLEVLYNGTWGTVCDDYFGSPDGLVVCRQLGYIGFNSTSTTFGAGEGPIWIDDVGCTGSEQSIFNCTHKGIGEHNCDHGEDVGIICDPCTFNAANVEDGSIQLAGGNCYSSGRVEIFHGGEWGVVCDRLWDLEDAMVVCRQLGFQGSLQVPPRHHYGMGAGKIWLSNNIGCRGSESRLDECSNNGWGEGPLCYHGINTASVECEGESSILPLPTPQVELSFHTTADIIPSSVTFGSHIVFPSLQVSLTTTNQPSLFTHSASQMLPKQSTLPTSSDVDGDNLPQMELILGLVALGVLMLTSAILLSIVCTVCVCRSKRSKSVQVEDFQSADFLSSAGLVGKFEDSEVVLTNANTQN